MKYLFSLLLFTFSLSSMSAQLATPTIQIVDSNCDGFDIKLSGATVAPTTDCNYEPGQVTTGQNYVLSADSDTSADILGISTLDLVVVAQGLLNGFTDNLEAYKSDWDQDGVVTTDDYISMRHHILGVTNGPATYHIIKAEQNIPSIDPFDIQVDYSTLSFDESDFDNNLFEIEIVKIGDLRE